ncbi:MAG TPA: hypothetical protein DIW24_01125 [Bacteroidetes bacterium]|nr:hypothetical protein [Bacteroidota bacterium]HRR07848.1 hypothetical protein [Rhodothermales bacterium]
MKYYVVKYTGPFGFIKPWTAVRDEETLTQQFLTPSIIEGMKIKLEVSDILRHCISYINIAIQQEQTQPKGSTKKSSGKGTDKIMTVSRHRSILKRGVMIEPVLYLAFPTVDDAKKATLQHLCLCRNEDVMLPEEEVFIMTPEEFNALSGFELLFGQSDTSFLVGFNRFKEAEPMYGSLRISGNPLDKNS